MVFLFKDPQNLFKVFFLCVSSLCALNLSVAHFGVTPICAVCGLREHQELSGEV